MRYIKRIVQFASLAVAAWGLYKSIQKVLHDKSQ